MPPAGFLRPTRLLLVGAAFNLAPAQDFVKHVLSGEFHAEGASYGDFDGDGAMDVVSGPFIYAGPDFQAARAYYAPRAFDPREYSDVFLTFVHDFNGDGRPDILNVGFPGKAAYWYENPGERADTDWTSRLAFEVVDNESPVFLDVTGDGRPELLCTSGGRIGHAGPDAADPEAAWSFKAISPPGDWYRFTHGLGAGDLDGDGRLDILEKEGWWRQPPATADDSLWDFHTYSFSREGGAQMYAFDVDGDGDNDPITSLHAHGFGLAWFENLDGKGGAFAKHIIMGSREEEDVYGAAFSQLHALDLADMNGDGLLDIVTGKRRWAHGPGGDPEPNAPAVLYWFELRRRPGGGADFIPHLVDDDSGVGTQVTAGDLDRDGRPDVVVGNKKGTFVFLNRLPTVLALLSRRRTVSAPEIPTGLPPLLFGAGLPRDLLGRRQFSW